MKTDYLFPVRALSTVYRAKLLRALRQHELAIPAADTLMAKPWCLQQSVSEPRRNRGGIPRALYP
ncbi:transposase [Shewanella putrefaciens]|nr:transposase [Shewanella putrefaciens]